MTTWKELKAQGVKRCCAMFKDGTRCRRRVLGGAYSSWCGKHGPIMERIERETRDMLKRERGGKTVLAALTICVGLALHAPVQAADEVAIDGPVWIATDTLTCGKYKGVTWTGMNGAETFTRFYDVPERDRKNIILKDDGFYYKGKKC